jgi:hypothetical protein
MNAVETPSELKATAFTIALQELLERCMTEGGIRGTALGDEIEAYLD